MNENGMVLNALMGALFERSGYEPIVIRAEDMPRFASMAVRIDTLELTAGFRARVITSDPLVSARLAYADLVNARHAAEANRDPRFAQAAIAAQRAWGEALAAIPPSELGTLAECFDRRPTEDELTPAQRPRLVLSK